jgi:prepilin-type N-terminal cleavage/methylation domain-containing protein
MALSRLRAQAGMGLVELMVALAITSILLAVGWCWLVNVQGSTVHGATAAQVHTSGAFARRLMVSELRRSTGLSSANAGCSRHALTFTVPVKDEVQPDVVSYVWDESRRVLWRKAPGSYLQEDVSDFSVQLWDQDGRPLEPGAGGVYADAALVSAARVRLCLTVERDGGPEESTVDVALRGCQ